MTMIVFLVLAIVDADVDAAAASVVWMIVLSVAYWSVLPGTQLWSSSFFFKYTGSLNCLTIVIVLIEIVACCDSCPSSPRVPQRSLR